VCGVHRGTWPHGEFVGRCLFAFASTEVVTRSTFSSRDRGLGNRAVARLARCDVREFAERRANDPRPDATELTELHGR